MAGVPTMLWTVGHSTRTREQFLAVLEAYAIQTLADVRRFPGSRRCPWFGSDALARDLAEVGIEYHWLAQLGGRRKVRAGSHNGGWRNASFQGYADHLDSDEFATGMAALLELAARRRTVIMCAEALWWRCHRRLIADDFVARGWTVLHLLAPGKIEPHVLNPDAAMVDGVLRYPGPQPSLL